MILNPATRVRIPSGGQYNIRLGSLHRACPSLHSSGGSTSVPVQLNTKAIIGAFKLIDGCSLALLCSATVSVVSDGICHKNEVNSIERLYWRAQPKIVSSRLLTAGFLLDTIYCCAKAAVATKLWKLTLCVFMYHVNCVNKPYWIRNISFVDYKIYFMFSNRTYNPLLIYIKSVISYATVNSRTIEMQK